MFFVPEVSSIILVFIFLRVSSIPCAPLAVIVPHVVCCTTFTFVGTVDDFGDEVRLVPGPELAVRGQEVAEDDLAELLAKRFKF